MLMNGGGTQRNVTLRRRQMRSDRRSTLNNVTTSRKGNLPDQHGEVGGTPVRAAWAALTRRFLLSGQSTCRTSIRCGRRHLDRRPYSPRGTTRRHRSAHGPDGKTRPVAAMSATATHMERQNGEMATRDRDFDRQRLHQHGTSPTPKPSTARLTRATVAARSKTRHLKAAATTTFIGAAFNSRAP